MKAWLRTALLGLGLGSSPAWGEPDSFGVGSGRDGPLTVSEPGRVINRYAQVSGPAAPGDTVLLVADTDGFAKGDLVMVLQSTGLVPEPSPGGSKPTELSHDAVGRWEFARLSASGDGVLSLTAPLVNAYAAQVTQVIRVPEYTQLRIREGAEVRAEPWNGRTGGVVALLATETVINEGTLSATGAGFRGGAYVPDAFEPALCLGMSVAARPGARKGEGIAVTQYGPTTTGRESVSHGGGGGLCPLAGGGGGGNGGPGGRGGGSTELAGEAHGLGGEGGAKLVYSLANRLSFGGGGGSGQGEDELRPEGGAGGGAMFIRAHQLSGRGVILADGTPGGVAGRGGAGGGGAGGSIYLRFNASAECGGVFARGGVGGEASPYLIGAGVPGGGGGGGRILFQAASRGDCPLGVEAGTGGVALNSAAVSDFQNEAQPSRDTLLFHSGLIDEVTPAPAGVGGQLIAKPVVKKPVDGGYVNTKTKPGLEVEGTAEKGSKVTIYIDSQGITTTVSMDAQGAWKALVTGEPVASFKDHSEYEVSVSASLDSSTASSDPSVFTVDLVVPKATILNPSSLPVKTGADSITFSFAHDDKCRTEHENISLLCENGFYKDVYFECSMDGVVYLPCTSPKVISGLTTGNYKFFVRAKDKVNIGLPATHAWEVDRTPPSVTFDKYPTARTTSKSAEFAFHANESGTTFQCAYGRKDSSPQYANCTSPYPPIDNLQDGSYEFWVSAKDAFNNTAVYSYEWEVDVTGPVTKVISPPPSSPTNSQSVTFTLQASEPASRFECYLDTGKYIPCDSPVSYHDLKTGIHVFSARAIDDLENVGAPISSVVWEVDLTRPDTEITEAPDAVSASADARFVFRSKKKNVYFECKLDDDAFKSCGSNGAQGVDVTKEYFSLVEGVHTFRVQATDSLGNVEAEPAEYSWTVDTKPPTVEISQPTEGSRSTTPFVTVIGTAELGSTVFVFFDDVPHGSTTADTYNGSWQFKTTIKLSEGEHKLKVKAVDVVKHEAWSKVVAFTVNTFRPETKINSGPPNPDKSSSAVFVFSAPNARPGDVVEFTCQLDDSGKENPCEKVQGFSGLTNGSHKLQVRAWVDGIEDLSPEIYEWVVSIAPPQPPDILRPEEGGRMKVNELVFSGRSVPNGRVHVFIDGVENGIALTGPDGTWTFTPSPALSLGEHTIESQSEDEIGNKSEKRSALVSFIVEEVSDVIVLGEGGGGFSCSAGGTIPCTMLLWGVMLFLGLGRRRS